MRLIHSALLGALALAGAAATAAAQQPAPAAPPAAAHGARGVRGVRGVRAVRGDADRALFKGIQLSADEQARVEAVREKYAPQLAAARKADAPRMKAMREARQKGDTAAMRSLRASMARDRGQGFAVREQMQRDLRAALSPEHQAQFDANVAKQKSRFERGRNGARQRG